MAYNHKSPPATKVMAGTAGDVKSFAEWRQAQEAQRDAYLREHGLDPQEHPGVRVHLAPKAAPPAPSPTPPTPAVDPAQVKGLVELRAALRAQGFSYGRIAEQSWPHIRRIAAATKSHPATVEAALSALEDQHAGS